MVIFSLGLIYQEYFKIEKMISTARIEVQRPFCDGCSVGIKKELLLIEDISDVRLYPKDSLVTFNFLKINKLSSALNKLSDIGYPEKGERISMKQFNQLECGCS